MAEIVQVDRDILALEDVPKAGTNPDDEMFVLAEAEEKLELERIDEEILSLESDPIFESLSQQYDGQRTREVGPPSTLFESMDEQTIPYNNGSQ